MEKNSQLLNFSILNIDKPAGPTSFSISDYVRRNLGLNKTSHFGTLDPQVTGVLPVALGRACKLTGFFLGHDKEYVGVMHVHGDIGMKELQELINKKFLGKIMQLPPKKSRVKREVREREIKSFEILEQDGKDFLFRTEVQGGTYIRKLVHDLGEQEGVGSAHMTELRRVRAGIIKEGEKMINLYEFDKAMDEGNLDKYLIPAEEAIKKIMDVVQVREEEVKKLLTGKPLFAEAVVGKQSSEDKFAVFSGNRFIGIYKRMEENGMIGKSEFVYN